EHADLQEVAAVEVLAIGPTGAHRLPQLMNKNSREAISDQKRSSTHSWRFFAWSRSLRTAATSAGDGGRQRVRKKACVISSSSVSLPFASARGTLPARILPLT